MALYVLAMTVVFDLDAPQRGGIIVNQGPMQVLIETLEEIAPRATEP